MSNPGRSYEEWRALLTSERLPAAIVDLDAFDRNVAAMAAFGTGADKPIRIATKSIRVPDLIRRVLARGEPFRGLMCYSAEEAYFLREIGCDDFLIAYPTVQSSDLRALRELHEGGAPKRKITLVIDGGETARALAQGLSGIREPLRVALELDLSLRFFGGRAHLGVRRSPIRSGEGLRRAIAEVAAVREVKLVGMMGYEAQVAGLGDLNPFKKFMNPAFHFVRALSVNSAARRRSEAARIFADSGTKLEIFNGGGTGSLNWAAGERPLTEATAGSACFSPHLFDYYSNIRFEPACFFALQAVRHSDPGYVTCQGGGYIASGEPGWDRVPVPWLPSGAKLVSTEGCGEVQTPLRLPRGTTVALGDPVLFRHAKAGELMERFNEVILVQGGKIAGRAKTYRGQGLSFF